MQALVYEILQCIIHKPMARHASFTYELGAVDAYPKMGPHARAIGADMPSMGSAFVDHLQKLGVKRWFRRSLKAWAVMFMAASLQAFL